MAVIKAKPTSPGRRFVVKVVTPELHKGAPHKPLLEKQSSTGGRNNAGRVSTRHRGGGHKHHYRLIDFKRNKDGVPGVVERLEYDPNRSAHIALIKYADGERRYILAPRGVSAGAPIQSGTDAPIKPGNAMPLRSVPVGTMVHNIELKPGKGGQIARSAGAGVRWWLGKEAVPRSGCAAVRCAECSRSAGPPSVRWGTQSTACVPMARLGPCAGEVFARPFAGLP